MHVAIHVKYVPPLSSLLCALKEKFNFQTLILLTFTESGTGTRYDESIEDIYIGTLIGFLAGKCRDRPQADKFVSKLL